jgi:cytochrome b
MNTTSASRVDARPAGPPAPAIGARDKVLVWDAPVRVFHWLTVLSFAGAYLTAESERWRLLHVTLGYTLGGLVAFRIVWGLVGTRHARFANFVRGPAAVWRYLKAMLRGQPEHSVGHNPAGAWAIVALLALSAFTVGTGWALFNEVGGKWLEEGHEVVANLMLAVVGIHIAGVLLASRLHHENLVGAMVTGRKPGRPEDGVRSAWRTVAALMLVAALGFWWLQWQGTPAAGAASVAPAAVATEKHDAGHD